MTLDSRANTLREALSPYVTSEAPGSGWGQPSISHYVFDFTDGKVRGHIIGNIYIASPARPSSAELDLRAEFDAWEAASDEDLSKFEQSLE